MDKQKIIHVINRINSISEDIKFTNVDGLSMIGTPYYKETGEPIEYFARVDNKNYIGVGNTPLKALEELEREILIGEKRAPNIWNLLFGIKFFTNSQKTS